MNNIFGNWNNKINFALPNKIDEATTNRLIFKRQSFSKKNIEFNN